MTGRAEPGIGASLVPARGAAPGTHPSAASRGRTRCRSKGGGVVSDATQARSQSPRWLARTRTSFPFRLLLLSLFLGIVWRVSGHQRHGRWGLSNAPTERNRHGRKEGGGGQVGLRFRFVVRVVQSRGRSEDTKTLREIGGYQDVGLCLTPLCRLNQLATHISSHARQAHLSDHAIANYIRLTPYGPRVLCASQGWMEGNKEGKAWSMECGG